MPRRQAGRLGRCGGGSARGETLFEFGRRGAPRVAARLGLEPRQNESESFVLPLHHRAKSLKEARAVHPVGAGDGIRTRNRLFTKQVLYH